MVNAKDVMDVAILGMGAMGSRMAKRLIDAGHRVTVFNRTAARAESLVQAGARSCQTPAEAVKGAAVVIGMLTDDQAAEQVWLAPETGAMAALEAGSIAVESSTLSPGFVARLAGEASARDVAFVDAPVAGSRPQAEAGTLIYLVGGEFEAVEQVRPLLALMGGAIHHVGSVGAGARYKLAVNAFFGIQVVALSEVMAMLEGAGIPLSASAEVLASLPITSPGLQGVAGAIAAGQFAPLFPIDLVEKDMGYAAEEAQHQQIHHDAIDAARAAFQRAMAAGHGGDNIAGVFQVISH